MRLDKTWPFWGLLAMLILSIGISSATSKAPHVDSGDAPDYLTTAYHIAHDHVFARDATASAVPPGIGREPGYPSFLAALMLTDPELKEFRPECARDATSCDMALFRSASLANLALVELSGLLLSPSASASRGA
jgi:hypothetical protein